MRQYNAKSRSSCVSRLAYLSLALLVSGSVVILLVRLTLRAVEGVRASAPTTNINVAPTRAALPPVSAAYPLPSDRSNVGPQVEVAGFTEPSNGLAAPDFSLPSVNGDLVNLSDMRGRFVILNFWATWCGPCRVEMPELDRLYRAHEAHDLIVLAVNVTTSDSVQAVEAFIDELDLSFPVLLDATGAVTGQLYNVLGLPTTYFIDPAGTIMRMQLGPLTRDELDEFAAGLPQ